jgi:ribulose-phosphate 3-epimerase
MKKVALSIHAEKNYSIEILKKLYGLDYIHVDLMDGKFVKTKKLNLEIFKVIKNHFDIPIIAHMMVIDPSNYIDKIIDYVDFFLFHFEIKENKIILIEKVKAYNKKVGVVLNPETTISQIESLLGKIDMVLILGVRPGRSGQSFIPETVKKINNLAKYKDSYDFLIDVDGGITLLNAPMIEKADIITSASSILNAKDPNSVIKQLKETE